MTAAISCCCHPDETSRLADELLEEVGFELIAVEGDDEVDDENVSSEIDGERDTRRRLSCRSGRNAVPNFRTRRPWSHRCQVGGRSRHDRGTSRAWGAGYISLVANADYFANYYLADSDHARLLADTVAGYIEPGTVWFVYDAAFPSLWQVITGAAPYLVASLFFTLLLWLWSITPRFGPRVQAPTLERRSIIEHVTAAGRFIWRNRGAKVLTDSSIEAVLHETESRHPGIGRLAPEQQAILIAKMTGMKPQAILDALAEADEPRHREFVHNMQALQRIRNQL